MYWRGLLFYGAQEGQSILEGFALILFDNFLYNNPVGLRIQNLPLFD